MNLEEAIQTRRSIRKFQDREVPIDLIKQAARLACWAPNGSNLQTWRFFVIKSRDKIEQMAAALEAKAQQMSEWPEAAEYDAVVKGVLKNAAILRSAPVLVALGAQEAKGAMDALLEKRGAVDASALEIASERAGANSNAQTVASFASQFQLVLHSLGLGSVWMAGPMLARKEMEQLLGAPAGTRLFTLLPVGYPDESPAPQPRKPVEEVMRVL